MRKTKHLFLKQSALKDELDQWIDSQTGWPVLIFLLFATVLAYLSKKQIWAAVKPKKH